MKSGLASKVCCDLKLDCSFENQTRRGSSCSWPFVASCQGGSSRPVPTQLDVFQHARPNETATTWTLIVLSKVRRANTDAGIGSTWFDSPPSPVSRDTTHRNEGRAPASPTSPSWPRALAITCGSPKQQVVGPELLWARHVVASV